MSRSPQQQGFILLPLIIVVGVIQLIVFGIALAIPIGVFQSLLRPFYTGQGGVNTQGLERVPGEFTLLATFYTPGTGDLDMEGTSRVKVTAGNTDLPRYFYRNKSTGELIDYQEIPDQQVAMGQDDNFEMVTKFGDNKVARGGLAVNGPTWKGGTPFNVTLRNKAGGFLATGGTTYWLEIPGYSTADNLTPVVDIFATGRTNLHQSLAGGSSNNYRNRVDIAVKGPPDGNNVEYKKAEDLYCSRRIAGEEFNCFIDNVKVWYGNPFEGIAVTGNANTDAVLRLIATQVGRKEQPVGSNRGPEINQYFQNGSPGLPWCAYFTTWAFRQKNFDIPVFSLVTEVRQHFIDQQIYFGSKDSTNRPQPGDVFIQKDEAVLETERTKSGWSHTGIVVSVDGDQISTIEGNYADKVSRVTRAITEFSGFGRFK